jgi:hypothetical protein
MCLAHPPRRPNHHEETSHTEQKTNVTQSILNYVSITNEFLILQFEKNKAIKQEEYEKA